MNLIEESFQNKEEKKKKRMSRIILGAIIFIVIIIIAITNGYSFSFAFCKISKRGLELVVVLV